MHANRTRGSRCFRRRSLRLLAVGGPPSTRVCVRAGAGRTSANAKRQHRTCKGEQGTRGQAAARKLQGGFWGGVIVHGVNARPTTSRGNPAAAARRRAALPIQRARPAASECVAPWLLDKDGAEAPAARRPGPQPATMDPSQAVDPALEAFMESLQEGMRVRLSRQPSA